MSGIPATEIAAAGRALLRLVPKEGPLPTPCWIWPGATAKNGYGSIQVAGRVGSVHSLMWRALVGLVPPGLELHHECETPACANPAHLRPVTHRENVLLGVSPFADRARQTACIHGHKFTPANTGRTCRGTRRCLTCHREQQAIRDAAARAVRNAA